MAGASRRLQTFCIRLGTTDEALATCRRSESLLAGLAGADAAARAALAYCRTRLARLLMFKGEYRAALMASSELEQTKKRLPPSRTPRTKLAATLAETVRSIGYLLWITGNWEEAVPELRTAMAIYQKLADENPDVRRVPTRPGEQPLLSGQRAAA